MKEWIAEYVQTARNCRKFGRKEDGRNWMARAKALKSYLKALEAQ